MARTCLARKTAWAKLNKGWLWYHSMFVWSSLTRGLTLRFRILHSHMINVLNMIGEGHDTDEAYETTMAYGT